MTIKQLVNVIMNEAVRSMTNNLGERRWGVGNDEDRKGGGATTDVCPREPDTLATPLDVLGVCRPCKKHTNL